MAKNFFDDEEPLTPQLASSFSSLKIEAKNKLKKTILVLLTLVICAIAVTYFFFTIIKSSKSYKGQDIAKSSKSNIDEVIANSYLNLEPIIVNLLNSNNKQNYAKVTLILQVSSGQEISKIEASLPVIIDVVQNFLRELRVEDFNGSGNTLLLKEEILKRVNKTTYPILVNDILFKELLIN